jgi:type VI secretion system protein ImpI
MIIRLQIENADRLPDGGPLTFAARDAGFEIGREGCDWTLPDPDKIVSGRHCAIRYQVGVFWLYDISRNGTFVNGSAQRLANPHRLAHGDRLRIGRYIVSVALEDGQSQLAGASAADSIRPASVRQTTAEPDRAGTMARSDRDNSSLVRQADIHLVRQGAGPRTAPSQQAAAPATSGPGARADELLRYIADGAGVSPETLLQRDSREVASEIGAVLRIVVDELAQLLKARAAAKVLAKSGHRTMIGSIDNNPLKFVPTSEEILDIMFARRRAGYLDARRSIEDAFRDLKSHELATYAAMQSALRQLLDELAPEAIEKKVPPSSFTSRKSRAWDTFVATWIAKEEAHENGMLDVFLSHFSEAYAKASRQK